MAKTYSVQIEKAQSLLKAALGVGEIREWVWRNRSGEVVSGGRESIFPGST